MVSTKRHVLLLAAVLLGMALPSSPVSATTPDHDIWVLDQIIYQTPKDPSVVAEILKTHSIDALITVLQSHQIEFQRRENRVDTAIVPSDLYATISALPAGEPFIAPDGDRSYASVIVGHESDPSTGKPN
jgi:peptidyl-prolyl cis-trans isomerase C